MDQYHLPSATPAIGRFARAGAVTLAVCAAVLMTCQRVGTFRLSPEAAADMRSVQEVVLALNTYYLEYAELPDESLGADAAFAGVLKSLQVDSEGAPLALEECVCDGEGRSQGARKWYYAGKECANALYDRMIYVCLVTEQGTYCGLGSGMVVMWWRGKVPAQVLVGSWLTTDGFLARDASVYEEWSTVHREQSSIVRWSDSEGFVRGARDRENGVTCSYSYRDEKLSGCVVAHPEFRIVESVECDEYGRIVGIHRAPANWQELWESSLLGRCE